MFTYNARFWQCTVHWCVGILRVFIIDFFDDLWYNAKHIEADLPPFFIAPPLCGAFYLTKEKPMIKTPQFLRKLMRSDAYINKDNPSHSKTNAEVTKQLQRFYPGTLEYDATGRMAEPEYDMTLEQFEEAEAQIKVELDEKIKQIKKGDDENDEDAEESETEFKIILSEIIPVRVLMNDDVIETKNLEIYDVEILDSGEENEANCQDCGWPIEVCICDKEVVYVWCSGGGCDACASMAGTILSDPNEAGGMHPNCACYAEEMTKEEYEAEYGKPDPEKQAKLAELNEKKKEWKEKEVDKDKNFETAYKNLKEPEGGYTDGKNQKKDEPTNMGIKQSTLDDYSAKHPDKEFPKDVKDLKQEQAREIYKDAYWDKTDIPKIENDRIRNAVFDMNVMGGAGRVTQNALNSYADAGLKVDGKIGANTIKAINSIPENKVPEFMDTLKAVRFDYLRSTTNWPTAKGGWTIRTNNY